MDNLQEKDWPSLKPVNHVKCDSVKDKKCDLCSFVTHKSYNLKKHRKIHDRVPVEKSVQAQKKCDRLYLLLTDINKNICLLHYIIK